MGWAGESVGGGAGTRTQEEREAARARAAAARGREKGMGKCMGRFLAERKSKDKRKARRGELPERFTRGRAMG